MKVIAHLRRLLSKPNYGLERFCNKFYGVYTGVVVDNKDPQGRGRVLATCPAININVDADVPENSWMLTCMNGLGTTPDGQTTGTFCPYEVGTNILIQFLHGDPQFPVCIGGFPTTKQVADTFTSDDMESIGPSKRGIRTKSGHFIRFNDDPDKLEITISKGDGKGNPSKQLFSFTKEGHTLITNDNGSYLYMNAEDDETSMATLDKKGNVLSMLLLGNDKISMVTKSGGALGIDGKDIVLTGDNVVADCNRQFSANAGTVMLGKGAKEPVIRGYRFALGYGIIHQHTTTVSGLPTLPGTTPPVMLYNELSESVFIS